MSLPDYIPNAKVFMIIKTYPNLSRHHGELVCTAGICQGEFVRIYPIKFRDLDDYNKFKKYQWINVNLKKRPRSKDFRLESYSPDGEIKPLEYIDKTTCRKFWQSRMRIIDEVPIRDNLQEVINEAKRPPFPSLAILKPVKILDFVIEPTTRDWSEAQKAYFNQPDLFRPIEKLTLKKLPYKYSYRFTTKDRQERTLMIEDWEIGALFWNCMQNNDGNENDANQKVRKKYLDIAKNPNVFFFIGTALSNHKRSPNPFIIIGVGAPDVDINTQQMELF